MWFILRRTLINLVGGLVLLGLFRVALFVAPSSVLFKIHSIPSLFWPQEIGDELSIAVPDDAAAPERPFGLLELVPGIDPIVDIVAIHGLDGHRNLSWTAKNGVFWLRDLLHDKIPEARILTYGYDAYTRGQEQFSVQTLHDQAQDFISTLVRKRRETSTQERPIIFVAHSLGGIMLKSALIHSHATHSNHLIEHKAIDLSTYGILFMGTPHQGSDAADWGTLLLNIAKISQRTNDAILKNIQKDSEALQHQLSQFLSISANFETKFFYETYRTLMPGGIDMLIVPKASAVVPGARNVETIAVHKDHVNMVKFASGNDEDFKTLSSHLFFMMEAAPAKISANWEHYRKIEGYTKEMVSRTKPCLPVRLQYGKDNDTFFGREEELEWIHENFVRHHVLAIYGLGGIGKTRIAVEFIYAYEHEYNAIFWANAATNETLTSDFVSMAQQLVDCERTLTESGKAFNPNFTSEARRSDLIDDHGDILTATNVTDQVVLKVISWLSAGYLENWLLVLDNADDLDIDIRAFFPSIASGRILITSRDASSRYFGNGREVIELAENDAISLLETKAGKERADGAAARKIVQSLYCFPLAIEQAGAYISARQLSFAAYLEQYSRDSARLTEVLSKKLARSMSPYKKTVFTTWEASYSTIESRNPYAAHLLLLCGFFGPEFIPMDFFWTRITGDDERLDDAFEQIFSFSLAKRTSEVNSVSMHPLVHAWSRERLDEEHQAKLARDALDLLGVTLTHKYDSDRWYFERKIASHLVTCVEIAARHGVLNLLSSRWKVLPYLPMWVTNTIDYGILQRYRFSDHHFVRLLDEIARACDSSRLPCAKELRRATLKWSIHVLGANDFWTLRRMTGLGRTLQEHMEFEEATKHILCALERHEKIEGLPYGGMSSCVGLLSDAHLALSTVLEAVGPLRRFIDWPKTKHTPNYRRTCSTAYELGVHALHHDRVSDAEELLRHALKGLETIQSPDDNDDDDDYDDRQDNIYSILLYLAAAVERQNRLQEAEGFYRRALEWRGKVLGQDNADTLAALIGIARATYNQGKYEDAEVLYRRVLEYREKSMGPNHLDTIRSLANLGDALARQRNYKEAETFYRRALDGREKLLGPNHHDTLEVLTDVAQATYYQGKYEDAEDLYRRALERHEKSLGPDHLDTLGDLVNVGHTLAQQHNYTESESFYRRALEGREKVLGQEDPDTLAALIGVAHATYRQGKYEDAEGLYRRVFERCEKSLGPEHLDTLISLVDVGHTLAQQHNHIEAERFYRRALEGRNKVLGPDHHDTLEVLTDVAHTTYHQGKYEDAEGLYRRALERHEKSLGPDHLDTLRSMVNVGKTLAQQRNFTEAESFYRRALDGLEKLLGPNHHDTVEVLADLAVTTYHQGKYEDAESLYRHVLEHREKSLGPDHAGTLFTIHSLGWISLRRNKSTDAERLLLRALEGLEKSFGPDHLHTLLALSDLVVATTQRGNFEQAEKLLRRALRGWNIIVQHTDAEEFITLHALGMAAIQLGWLADADGLLRRALAGLERLLGPDHHETLLAYTDFGVVSFEQGRFEEAEAFFERALEGRVKSLGPEHPETLETRERLRQVVEERRKVG